MKSIVKSRSGKAKPVPSQASSYGGLCPNCANLDICSLAAEPRRQVFYCEEFAGDEGTPALISQPVQGPVEREVVREGTGEDHAEDHAGLCATCRNWDGCVFSKHEGGVWHCEEYR